MVAWDFWRRSISSDMTRDWENCFTEFSYYYSHEQKRRNISNIFRFPGYFRFLPTKHLILYTVLKNYYSAEKIWLLNFWINFQDVTNTLGKSKAFVVRQFPCFLHLDSRDAYNAQINRGNYEMAMGWSSPGHTWSTWSYVALRRITVSKTPTIKCSWASKSDGKTRRDSLSPPMAGHVTTSISSQQSSWSITNFVAFARPSERDRERLKEVLKRWRHHERYNITTICNQAHLEGTSHNAQDSDRTSSSGSAKFKMTCGSTVKLSTILMVVEELGPSYAESTLPLSA